MSPISAVLDAIQAGASTHAELQRRTQLDPDVLSAAVDHLHLIGRISRPSLRSGCPATACASCPIATDGACRV